MPQFPSTNPLVTGIDAGVIATQQKVNVALSQMPHPDPRTPDGLEMLRTLTANNEAGTVLAPIDRHIDIASGPVRLHTLVPDGPIRAVMLDIHGAGWAAGAPEDDDTLNDQLARALHIAVVAPDYRLTPDVTIGEQIDDCVAVAEWIGASAEAEYGTEAIIIGGISAGAHLAAATLLRLRDNASPTFRKVVAARLDSGPYDLGFTPSAYLSTEDRRMSAYVNDDESSPVAVRWTSRGRLPPTRNPRREPILADRLSPARSLVAGRYLNPLPSRHECSLLWDDPSGTSSSSAIGTGFAYSEIRTTV